MSHSSASARLGKGLCPPHWHLTFTPPPYQEDPEHVPFQSPGPKTQFVRHPSSHLPNIWTCSGEPLISSNFFPHLSCLFKENKLLLIRSAVETLGTSELPTFRHSV